MKASGNRAAKSGFAKEAHEKVKIQNSNQYFTLKKLKIQKGSFKIRY